MKTNVARKGQRSRWMLAVALGLWLVSSGCASVHAYQRERLADRIMSFKTVAKEESRLMKSFESREGSTGGTGGSGGGCACN